MVCQPEVMPAPDDQRVHVLIRGGDVVTMDADRRVLHDGAVAVAGTMIVAVDGYAALHARYPDVSVIGSAEAIVTPGYVNAHQHLTGDRLVRSCIPEAIESQEAIFGWAVPVHGAHTADDDELSATLAAVDALSNGITCTIEAGTVAHPLRVAAGVRAAGMRARIGRWGWDIDGAPYAAPCDEVLELQRDLLDRLPLGGLVEGGVTLVGHDLMSDELAAGAASLARQRGVGMTFHISPHAGDPASYLARTGLRPLVHLDRLGVLGPNVVLAHAVHLDDAEVEAVLMTGTAVASCPWAYLRLAQGFIAASRHDELYRRGGRVALGCDAENAGDAVDLLRAATVFVGLYRDRAVDVHLLTAEDALALATIRGAEAVGKGAEIGSLEPGKQADVVVHGTAGMQFLPRGTDPVRQLIWASDGRSVRDVVVAGRQVIADGRCLTVDVDNLRAAAAERRDALLRASGHG